MLIAGSAGVLLSAPGPAPDVVILSGGGRVPETGSVDLGALQNATKVPGVVASSPEVYAPVVLEGRIAVVRGVNLTDFSLVQSGSPGAVSAPALAGGTVLVGQAFAQAWGVGAGSVLSLQGVLANFSAKVTVAGVEAFGSPYSGEIVSSLHLAQELRGLSGSQATFLRLRVDPATFNRTLLLRAIAGSPAPSHPASSNPVIQQLQLAPTATLLSIYPAGAPPPSTAAVIGKGAALAQAVLESLDAVVLVASLLAVYFVTSYWLDSVRPTSETLGALGMGKGKELAWHLAAAVPASLAAALAGSAAAFVGLQYLSGVGGLSFFFQPLQVSLDPASVAFSCAGPTLAVAASIVVSLAARRG